MLGYAPALLHPTYTWWVGRTLHLRSGVMRPPHNREMPQGVRGLNTPPYNNSALLLTFGTSRRRSGCAVQPDITKVSSRKPYLSFFLWIPPLFWCFGRGEATQQKPFAL